MTGRGKEKHKTIQEKKKTLTVDKEAYVLNTGLSAKQYLPVSLRRTQRNPPKTRGGCIAPRASADDDGGDLVIF